MYGTQVSFFFSNGAASQLKQKFLLENITFYKQTYMYDLDHVTWSFFATSHGKGSVDGTGGQVKRVVFSACKRGAFMTDAKSFAAEASKHMTKTYAREIKEAREGLDARWADVKTL